MAAFDVLLLVVSSSFVHFSTHFLAANKNMLPALNLSAKKEQNSRPSLVFNERYQRKVWAETTCTYTDRMCVNKKCTPAFF